MSGFEDLAKKAFYMGVGFASYAQEKANDNFKELRTQAQSLADEMVERGKINTEEARKFVDELVEQAQKQVVTGTDNNNSESREPRRIEIIDEEEPQPKAKSTATPQPETSTNSPENDDLRQQVESLKEELRRLKSEM